MNTTGNTILITGGTSGIGLAFAEEFLKRKNKVIVCGRREDRLAALKAKHAELETIKCDISISSERDFLAKTILEKFPNINIIINNAGVQLAMDLNNEVSLKRIMSEVDTNFIAPIHLSSLFVKHLSQNENAAIINISSGLAFVPIAFMPVYCATKAAIHSYTISLRHQLKNTSIKVFEIAPPSVDTELGHDRRSDPTQSHGGLPVNEFLTEAMQALENDLLEAPIAQSKFLREKGMEMFETINGRFEN